MSDRYDDLREYNWLQREIVLHETDQATALGKLILDKFGPKDTVDIGCGPGIYLLPFKDAGCRVFGVDGAPAAGQFLDPREFALADLRQPWTPPCYFDLALCIEVLEHIAPEYADTVVETICRCAPLLFISAAHPGQGGESHLNENTFEYWQAMFESRGFVFDRGLTDSLTSVINVDPVYSRCHWLQWHSWVFRKA